VRIQHIEGLGPCLVMRPIALLQFQAIVLTLLRLFLFLGMVYSKLQLDALREALDTFGTHNAHCACAPPTKTRTPYVAPSDAW